MRFFAKNTRCLGLALPKRSKPADLNSDYEKSQNWIDFSKICFFPQIFFLPTSWTCPWPPKIQPKFGWVPNDVNNWTTKGFCQIPKTLIRRNFQKNRQILLLRIFEGPKYHVFESISGRRPLLMRVGANTIYAMSSIYWQNRMPRVLELDFREP